MVDDLNFFFFSLRSNTSDCGVEYSWDMEIPVIKCIETLIFVLLKYCGRVLMGYGDPCYKVY